ncbi:MAG: trimethylamine--corrinoid methyltransferase, partial [Deltaproteobacteria bacterium]|nr:trimethylamine--corrinoid methyltransferase [Deltaproteobacteria bacterium]
MNEVQVEQSRSLLGDDAVEMLLRAHEDALWILENLGVGCKQPDIQAVFQQFEADGLAVVYNDRIFVTSGLVERCLKTVPGVADFFAPTNSFFIGGTAPYVYDDEAGRGGLAPTAEHMARIAQIVEQTDIIAGMGRGIKLKDEVEQMNIMVDECSKPLYFAVTSD